LKKPVFDINLYLTCIFFLMKNEETMCLQDVICELQKLDETIIRSDTPGEKYVPPGHGFRFKKGEKKTNIF